MKDTVTVEIPQEMLTATIEAMRELQERCEADACALARLPNAEVHTLFIKQIEAARVAADLFSFFAAQ